MVILFGLVGFVVGYFQQDFRMTFYFLSTGGGISAVVSAYCRAEWPAHPVPLALRPGCSLGVALHTMRRFACLTGRGGTGIR